MNHIQNLKQFAEQFHETSKDLIISENEILFLKDYTQEDKGATKRFLFQKKNFFILVLLFLDGKGLQKIMKDSCPEDFVSTVLVMFLIEGILFGKRVLIFLKN